jgi:hypothetical protein
MQYSARIASASADANASSTFSQTIDLGVSGAIFCWNSFYFLRLFQLLNRMTNRNDLNIFMVSVTDVNAPVESGASILDLGSRVVTCSGRSSYVRLRTQKLNAVYFMRLQTAYELHFGNAR